MVKVEAKRQMNIMNCWTRTILVVWLVALSSGCGMFEPKPTSIAANLTASQGLNPDPNNRPSPLVVRIYELGSLSGFEQADFNTLWRNQDSLGQDLKGRHEVIIKPGDEQLLEREVKTDALYVGVLAAYRRIEVARWRASLELELNERNAFHIQLDDLAVTVKVVED